MKVKNCDLAMEIRLSIKLDRISNRFIELFLLIRDGIAAKNNWRGYSWIDDAKGDATVKFLDKWRMINPDKNPHSYIYALVNNTFINYQKAEQREYDKMENYRRKSMHLIEYHWRGW